MVKVTCNPPKGKKGYTINFRHPIVKDNEGKYGLKVHRGLGTDDEKVAKNLVEQIDKMLNDEYWGDRSKRNEAYLRFDPIVVDAFFDPMDSDNPDEKNLLDTIKLPGKEEGYSRETIIGPSGVGKTTLVRMLMGTIKEKFPTTSTGRTTTCNMELILSEEDDYEVVVTFMSRHQVEMFAQECIENAIEYCIKNDLIDRNTLSDKLLIHKDLIVRFSYILGDLSLRDDSEEEDFDFDDEKVETEIDPYDYSQDITQLLKVVNDFLNQIIDISSLLKSANFDIDNEKNNLVEKDEVLAIKDEIVNEVMKRFQLLTKGERINSKGKWVNAWYYKTNNRSEFIKTIKMFSSNSKNAWGGLLTPIVKSMRVKGKFSPDIEGISSKLVLFDGQGLGHKTTATSIPNEIVEHFKLSDSIIIVDNAQAPMLDNVKMALKAVIDYGYSKKVSFAFTHVDLMKGDNFHKFKDKKNHIVAALDSYLYEMKKQNNDTFTDVEAEAILNSTYFFSSLDNEILSDMTKKYTRDLLDVLRTELVESISVDNVTLKYDAMTLYSHLQLAMRKYRTDWAEVIGFPSKNNRTEHWSRIKALSRRLAYFDMDHYNYELMPLSDLRQEISAQINLFFNKPLDVMPIETKEEVRVTLINIVKSEVNAQLVDFIKEHMWKEEKQFNRWREAYEFTGVDSTYYRASKINEILELAAPQLDNFEYNMTEMQKKYVMELMKVIETTLVQHKCSLERFNY